MAVESEAYLWIIDKNCNHVI